MVVNAFQHSSKLQVLKLVYKARCSILPEYVPECLLHHLKTFEWRDYGGTKYEKEVIPSDLYSEEREAISDCNYLPSRAQTLYV